MSTNEQRQLALIRDHSSPMLPLPTGAKAVLTRLPDIQAVLFDVYGTLFVSASGEISTWDSDRYERAFAETLAQAGIEIIGDAAEGQAQLRATVLEMHEVLRAKQVEFPEVDIVKVWKSTLSELRARGLISVNLDSVDVPNVALEFELRTNPVWPMPGAQQCLTELAARGVRLGLISNGQWFSPLLFPALLGGCLETLGVPPDLQLWSYLTGEAKPGLTLFRQAKAALGERGIPPEKVLFVGNDMLFDILPAATIGFRTALFAGDTRSLRLRVDDERVSGVTPDLIILNLVDIVRCVRPRNR